MRYLSKLICIKLNENDPEYIDLIEYGLLNFVLIFTYIVLVLVGSIISGNVESVIVFVVLFMIQILISIGIGIFSPQDHTNLRLMENEKRYYRKKTINILVLYNIISAMIILLKSNMILKTIELCYLFNKTVTCSIRIDYIFP